MIFYDLVVLDCYRSPLLSPASLIKEGILNIGLKTDA